MTSYHMLKIEVKLPEEMMFQVEETMKNVWRMMQVIENDAWDIKLTPDDELDVKTHICSEIRWQKQFLNAHHFKQI